MLRPIQAKVYKLWKNVLLTVLVDKTASHFCFMYRCITVLLDKVKKKRFCVMNRRMTVLFDKAKKRFCVQTFIIHSDQVPADHNEA
jgi:hypothetical protein